VVNNFQTPESPFDFVDKILKVSFSFSLLSADLRFLQLEKISKSLMKRQTQKLEFANCQPSAHGMGIKPFSWERVLAHHGPTNQQIGVKSAICIFFMNINPRGLTGTQSHVFVNYTMWPKVTSQFMRLKAHFLCRMCQSESAKLPHSWAAARNRFSYQKSGCNILRKTCHFTIASESRLDDESHRNNLLS